MEDPEIFLQYAKQFVVGAHAVKTAETEEAELTVDDIYVVSYIKVLGNWKVLLATNDKDKGLYFEVMQNNEKEETYVDTYVKESHHVFSHHDF